MRWAISHGFEPSSRYRDVGPARDAGLDLAGLDRTSPTRKRRVTSGRRSSRSPARTANIGSSVLLNGVNRQLDQYLQTQLRTETSGAAYADIRSTYLANLQNVYGNPAETGTIEDSFNKLLTAFQGLSTSPDSQSARIGAVAAAQTMAQTLNATTQGIQSLRANAEMGINDSIITANNAMAQIAVINNQLQNSGQTDAATASLLDQRDQYITQLSQLDGRQNGHQQPQSGDGIHQLRRATGRHRGVRS